MYIYNIFLYLSLNLTEKTTSKMKFSFFIEDCHDPELWNHDYSCSHHEDVQLTCTGVIHRESVQLGVIQRDKSEDNKCSDRSMEMLLPDLVGNYDRPTDQPTDRRTCGVILKLKEILKDQPTKGPTGYKLSIENSKIQ